MTINSSSTIELKLLSFEAPGKDVAAWLIELLEKWPEEEEVWLLLEQMHKFKFKGPDSTEIKQRITENSLGIYGLRGRLFFKFGQIEWRRLNPHTLRVVAMTEAEALAAPEGVKNNSKDKDLTYQLAYQDDRLVMWGTLKDDRKEDQQKFYERRVAGSAAIDDYPAGFINKVAGFTGNAYPTLPFRTYFNDENKALFRRFLPPQIEAENILRNPVQVEKQTGKVINNA